MAQPQNSLKTKIMKKILLIALLSTSNSFSQCFIQIVSGEQHTIAIADDGTLWGWGSNSSGEAGISASSPNHVNTPTQIGTATNWTDIDCGSYHSMALNSDDELYTWGYNVNGQLGTGDNSVRNSPTLISGEWKAIGAGFFHSFAITIDGALFGTGNGNDGQLGNNAASSYNQFTAVASGNDWKVATGGESFSIALKNDGTMYASGANGNGQFGNGLTTSSDYWVQTTTAITNWEKIDAGVTYAFGLTDAGFLYSWGNNAYGQLGHNGTTQQVDPQPVSTNIIDFSAGYHSSIWTNGTNIYTAGQNGYFQAQSGNPDDVIIPNTWTSFTSPTLVTMGVFSSSVIASNGLTTWGRNDRGICANGNFINVSVPTLAVSCTIISVDEIQSFDGTIYPNPVNDLLTISLSEASAISISDINGKQLLNSALSDFHQLNLTHFQAGIYLVQTENGATTRFVKQ